MPTGSGKTAVMTLLPFLFGSTRVLVVTPSQLVRDQAANEFKIMSVLREAGILKSKVPRPKVKLVRHKLKALEDWQALSEFDVIVGTPHTLSPAMSGVAEPPDGLIDLLLVDEAHHSPATTWAAMMAIFSTSKTVLFTATPFRRDEKTIPGKLVYQYPIGKAMEDGVYQPVHYVPVPFQVGQDSDQVLAAFAKVRMEAPEHKDSGSKLLVRTDRIAHAAELEAIYQSAGLRMGTVDSHKSLRTNNKTIDALRSGELDGLVSVGVLGEGFDLPALKVAVYHQPHKSLPATLQFIGRIARTGPQFTRAELLAVSAHVSDETKILYAEDKNWATLIPELSEAAVEREQEKRVYLEQFQIPTALDLSPYLINPQLEARILTGDVSELRFNEEVTISPPNEVVYQDSDEDESLLVLITRIRSRPRWIRSSALDTVEYDLHVCFVDRERGLLFISSTSDATNRQLIEAVHAEGLAIVDPQAIIAVLEARDVQSYFSVGMRSARAPGQTQPAYKQLAGRGIEGAVTATDSRAFGLGHAIATYEGADGSIHGIGVSIRKGKVWEMGGGGLLEYREWCGFIGSALAGGSTTGRVPRMNLLAPERLDTFPAHPLGLVWHERLLNMGAELLIDGRSVSIVSIDSNLHREDDHALLVHLVSDLGADIGAVRLLSTGAVEAVGDPIEVHSGTNRFDPMALDGLLQDLPPTIYFGDGSSVRGQDVFRGIQSIEPLLPQQTIAHDWSGVDIRHESKLAAEGTVNIHDHIQRILLEAPDAIVIKDDASNEIADFVVLRQVDAQSWAIEFHHCKASGGAVRARVEDLYEVCGQAIKSVRWAQTSQIFAELERRLRERASTSIVSNQSVEETAALLLRLQQDMPRTFFTAFVIQPGLPVSSIQADSSINTILVSCSEWLSAQRLEFRVMGNVLDPEARTRRRRG